MATTVKTILEKTWFLLILRTGRRYKTVDFRDAYSITLEQAIIETKTDPKEIIGACVMVENEWFPIASEVLG